MTRHVVSQQIATPGQRRIQGFLERERPVTPCLVIDLPTVRERLADLRAAMPDAGIFYAVKANPAPEIVAVLVAEGAGFDVASTGEAELCLGLGAAPAAISYGNTIKKPRDIAHAYQLGVRRFVSDSEQDVRAIAQHAPGSEVMIRVLVGGSGSACPFGAKFGCAPDMAVDLLRLAATLGLTPSGVAFHPGSQQRHPDAWDAPIATVADITERVRADGIELITINLGGGLPVPYRTATPPLGDFATAILASIGLHFGPHQPTVMIEPGRVLVAEAGVIRSEVVSVVRKSHADAHRWVYLDIGRYGGLAETEGEAIAYPVRTSVDGGPVGPAVIAGPTCDGDDVLYQRTRYDLPLELSSGDHVDLLAAGAYTASYASVAFNGFAPILTYCIDTTHEGGNR